MRPLHLAAAVLLAAAPGTTAVAGVVWTTRLADSQPGEPPPARVIRLAEDRMRIDAQDLSLIIRLDLGLIWQFSRAGKTAGELRFADVGRLLEGMRTGLAGLEPERRAEAERMLASLESPVQTIRVDRTGETRRAAGHPCEVYAIRGGPVRAELCAATDRPMPEVARSFYRKLAEVIGRTPGMEPLRGQAEAYAGIAGLPVEEITMRRGPDGEEVAERYVLESIERLDLDPALFELPAGYERLVTDPLTGTPQASPQASPAAAPAPEAR